MYFSGILLGLYKYRLGFIMKKRKNAIFLLKNIIFAKIKLYKSYKSIFVKMYKS